MTLQEVTGGEDGLPVEEGPVGADVTSPAARIKRDCSHGRVLPLAHLQAAVVHEDPLQVQQARPLKDLLAEAPHVIAAHAQDLEDEGGGLIEW